MSSKKISPSTTSVAKLPNNNKGSLRVPILLLIIFGLALIVWNNRGQSRFEVQSYSGPTMGTQYNVSVVARLGEKQEPSLGLQFDKRLAEFNQLMSTYEPDSELSRFNESDSTEWFEVSGDTAEVVAYALELASETKGAYDPTVGPLVNLWGFGPGRKRNRSFPTDEQIEEASKFVGYQQVEVRLEPPALRKQNIEVYLDLSSIAKGDGVDAIARLLDSLEYEAYMVEIGGEVRTRGNKPSDEPWKIGIESPDPRRRSLQKILKLSGESVATSGDYRNFFEQEGVRYSHTIDPRTGRPVLHNLATVSVLADNCREADALATALLVLGPKAGYDWAVEKKVAAYFISRSEAGPEVQRTAAWEELVPADSRSNLVESAETLLNKKSKVLEPTL